ncbi:MAG TPA: hypothetical protein VNK43_05495 [Gemmatimonadales bacterium]|nr:hypothetical protein [Gemmatimonadales bacterium]
MRGYWIKIALGALGVFLVGMLAVGVSRWGHRRVKAVVESSEPLEIPLAFVPFSLDGERLGEVDRLVIRRNAPDAVDGVEVRVDLADSVPSERLAGCRIAIRDIQSRGHKNVNLKRLVFRCVRDDSALAGLEPFGEVHLARGGPSFPLYVPAEVARDLREMDADSAAAAQPEELARMADSIERLVDSIVKDSINAAVLARSESALLRMRVVLDSLRARQHGHRGHRAAPLPGAPAAPAPPRP